MTKIHDLINLGQSIWFDYIRRSFTKNGDLQKLLDQGARGVTSNPAIFEKAIAGSSDYDADINRLVNEGKSVGKIYETLALEDIAQAADLLRPLYDESSGGDGYVSLEVSPTLAHNTQGTIAEAKRLFLDVAADDEGARGLYHRLGFLGTGLRRGYYARPDGTKADALTLAITL